MGPMLPPHRPLCSLHSYTIYNRLAKARQSPLKDPLNEALEKFLGCFSCFCSRGYVSVSFSKRVGGVSSARLAVLHRSLH
jgi:hypothetical protein